MGHIGLTPQLGGTTGFGTQGEDLESALDLVADAQAVAAAGAYSMVVEAVPADLARLITERVEIPTIGIGSGPECDGQTVVSTDLLGIESKLFLNFSRRYAELGIQIESAFRAYVSETQSGDYPGPELASPLSPAILSQLERRFNDGVPASPKEQSTSAHESSRRKP
jgi:3-methyl-2-oxobutanoate hydroxymethyltransferase